MMYHKLNFSNINTESSSYRVDLYLCMSFEHGSRSGTGVEAALTPSQEGRADQGSALLLGQGCEARPQEGLNLVGSVSWVVTQESQPV